MALLLVSWYLNCFKVGIYNLSIFVLLVDDPQYQQRQLAVFMGGHEDWYTIGFKDKTYLVVDWRCPGVRKTYQMLLENIDVFMWIDFLSGFASKSAKKKVCKNSKPQVAMAIETEDELDNC